VRVVNTHPLYEVLVVPLRSCFTLHAIVYLLLQSVVVSGKHFNTVLVTLTIQLQLVNQVLLGACYSFFFSDVLRELLVLRLNSLQILSLIPGPL
jgi:hypothetical protein